MPIDYGDRGWIPHIRHQLTILGRSMAVENAWIPSLQRNDDDSIPKMIAYCKFLTRKERILANGCQLWLKIVTIADLASINGCGIPFNHLKGRWRAQPSENFT